MGIDVKICGLSTPEAVKAAAAGGARYIGFVFFPPSPRFVKPAVAAELGGYAPGSVIRVGLTVDADDAALAGIVADACVERLQLHGRETPERVAEVRRSFGLPVIKALPIAGADDVAAARAYEDVADMLLFDARPPAGADRPGGNALSFDWRLLADAKWRLPWMLAGGLTAANLAEAVHQSGAGTVDVSSGVEDQPGVKDILKIQEFLRMAERC
ncbi:MAG: phosphoribosylanthranilate isomerase [Rhodospirillales bacterium]|nr:phosphoribosylanthranilate isomerase [Rhodospirillales bacterium]